LLVGVSSISPFQEEEVRAELEVEIRILRKQSFKADLLTIGVFRDDPLEINDSRTDHVLQ
jgi:hypothetical protein